jgi:hypothetical protein
MVKKQKEVIENANSTGYIIDYYGQGPGFSMMQYLGRGPDFNPNTALKIIRNDPTVKGAVVTLTDKVMEAGWGISGIDKRSRERVLEKKLKEVKMDTVIRKVISNLILYNNAFIEIVMKGDEVTDLNVLETTLMKITAKDNGDVINYYQEVGGRKTYPTWTPDKIVHIKIDELTTGVWSDLSIQSLYDTVILKDSIRQWLGWFFQTNQMKGLYAVESASDPKMKEFLSYLKAAEKDPTKPIIVTGKVTYQTLNAFADTGKSVLDLLRWCDEQLLEVLQTSPIAMGLPDASGRSNSAEQGKWINVRVKAIHNVLEEAFTYDLFKKINFGKVEFSFGVVDSLLVTDVLDNVQKMRNAMFTEEAIMEYLDSLGIVFKTSSVLKNPEQIAMEQAEQNASLSNKAVGTGKEGMIGNKSADSAPSRMRQSNNDVSKANKSVVKNAEDDDEEDDPEDFILDGNLPTSKAAAKFSKYPYTITPKVTLR